MSNSTESMSQWVLGIPDLNICFMWRSLLQGFLEVQELEFWTCLCHHQRSTFLLKQVISEFILVFDICRGDSSWIPVSQCEEWETLVKVGNAHVDQIKIVQLCIEDIQGCQFGCQQSSGNAPVDLAREECQTEIVNLLMDSWTQPLGCTSGPQALQWPKDVNLYNMMKLLALVGMKTWKGRGVR